MAAPPGSVVRSPKNSTSGPSPGEVAVDDEADDVVVAQRPHHRRGGVGTERHDGHAEARTEIGEPFEQLRWLDPLDHDRDRVPAVGDPAPRPLPAAEVRQGDDDALAPREAADDVGLVADLVEARGHGTPRLRLGSRKLSSQYARIGVECLLHAAAQSQPTERGVDAPEVTLDHRPSLRAGHVGAERQRCWPCRRRRARASPPRTARRAGTTRW